jgi:NAD-dependent dihydropyrimidine dehydrogenase PreA subunit
MSVAGWLVACLFRWLPHRSPTGLFPVGNPDEHSPVIITANFSLTVRRVRRAVTGQDLWLLVANSDGINVWCAAAGGAFTEHRVIDAIKVSRLSEKVAHRNVILPALSAPGVDRTVIRKETGFRAEFGPIFAVDIPAYLEMDKQKTDKMRRFRFGLGHRLDMLVSMNFIIFLVLAIVVAICCPHYLVGTAALFWSVLTVLYLFADVIPGRSGWAQGAFTATGLVTGWVAWDLIVTGDPLRHWGWFIAAVVITFAAGFDLAGIATARKSDPEQLLIRIRCRRLGSFFRHRALGNVTLDHDRCKGCGACYDICPLGVFGDREDDGRTAFRDQNACFACGACVKQCPESALKLTVQ